MSGLNKLQAVRSIVALMREGQLPSAACRKIGMTQRTLERWMHIKRGPMRRLRRLIDAARLHMDNTRADIVEDAAIQRIIKGDAMLTMFFLMNMRPGKFQDRRAMVQNTIYNKTAETKANPLKVLTDQELDDVTAGIIERR